MALSNGINIDLLDAESEKKARIEAESIEKADAEFEELERKSLNDSRKNLIEAEHQKALYDQQRDLIKSEAIQAQADNKKAYFSKQYDLKKYQEKRDAIKQDYLKKARAADAVFKKNLDKVRTEKKVEPKTKPITRATEMPSDEMDRIQSKVKTESKDHFSTSFGDGSAQGYENAADFALERDRRFNEHLDTLAESAVNEKSSDVKARIEAQYKFDKASYAVDQNYKVASLTGRPRDDQIKEAMQEQRQAALEIHQADQQLAKRNVEVKFLEEGPQVVKLETSAEKEIDFIYESAKKNADANNPAHVKALEQLNKDRQNIKQAIQNKAVDVTKTYDGMKSPKAAMMATAVADAKNKSASKAEDRLDLVKTIQKRQSQDDQGKKVTKELSSKPSVPVTDDKVASKATEMQKRVEASRLAEEQRKAQQQQKSKGERV